MKKKCRIESTFSLFDAAESQCVRNYVVSQLCDILKQSAKEQQPLVESSFSKILDCLLERLLIPSRDSKWELRTACGEALERILATVLQFHEKQQNTPVIVQFNQPFNCPDFNSLNVADFEANTLPLLAEDTLELPQIVEQQTSAEKMKSNQLELEKRLGFVLPNQILDSNVHLTPEDLPDFQQVSITSGSSSRELLCKVNPVRYLEHVCSSSSSNESDEPLKRVKKEETEVETGDTFLSSEISRIFLMFAQNVFNPSWQMRHGALLGLRAVFSLAIGRRNTLLIDYPTIRWIGPVVFCVLVADRFADYSSEEVTCPTQETAAQLLVYIAALQACSKCKSEEISQHATIFSKIEQMLATNVQTSHHWTVLYGVLSVLKYAAVLCSLKDIDLKKWNIATFHGQFFRHLDALLQNDSTEDDVRCLSCQIITEFMEQSPTLFDVNDLLQIKDTVVQYLVEHLETAPSSVCCRYLKLLQTLFQNDPSLKFNTKSMQESECVKQLLTLLSDLTPQTRSSVLSLFSSKHLLDSLEMSNILFAMHRLFSQLLVDSDPVELASGYSSTWTSLCQRLEFDKNEVDVKAAGDLLNKMFCLVMQHTNLPFATEMFAYASSPPTRPLLIGGEAVKNMDLSTKHLFIVRLRLQAVSLIGQLVDDSLLNDDQRRSLFQERVIGMLRFFADLRAGYPLFSFSAFIINFQRLELMPESLKPYLSERILLILQDANFTFEETIPLLSLIRELCKQLLEHFRSLNLKAKMPDALLDMAKMLSQINVDRGPAAIVDNCEQLQSRLKVALDEFGQLHLNMGRRTRMILAGAWLKLTLSQNALPEKLNPVVQPLMAVLLGNHQADSVEKCSQLVEIAASCLCDVLRRCYLKQRNPAPEVKIIRNLLTQSLPENIEIFMRTSAQTLAGEFFNVFPSLKLILEQPNPEDATRAFQIAQYLCGHIHVKDFSWLKDMTLKRAVASLLVDSDMDKQHLITKCIVAIADRAPDETMTIILRSFVAESMQSDSPNLLPSVFLASNLCQLFANNSKLQSHLVPFVRPVLSASVMGAQQRDVAAKCLSELVSLLGQLLENETCPEYNDPVLFDLWTRSFNLLQWLRNPSSLPPVDTTKLKGLNSQVSLRHYQIEGVTWLAFLQSNDLHGILADDLGLGKSLQALCSLAFDHQQAKTGRPSLILCPSTLIHHWEHEVEKFFTKEYLRPLVYSGSSTERRRIADSMAIDNYCVVIASYETFRSDANCFFLCHQWRFCILDEGHVIRNSKSKLFQSLTQLEARHRLVLTGTPVHNSVNDLWALFEFLMPGYLGTSKEFTAKYAKPIAAAGNPKANEADINLSKERLDQLHRATLPFVLRRLKGDVLSELPDKVIQDLYCDMTTEQFDLYQHLLGVSKKNRSQSSKGEGDAEIKHVFQLIRALRLVCNHPWLLRKNDGTLSNSCYSGKFAALKRLLIDLNILPSELADEELGNDEDVGDTTPITRHRALLFCQETACMHLIEDLFLKPLGNAAGLTWLRMDSAQSPAERFQTAQRFNNDASFDLLLLTTRVGGHGLNLTGADTVIFFDSDWNPQADLQAMDRAHRIGQKRTVHVFRLVTRASIEERVMSLQRFKLNVADSVINADNSNVLESLSAADLYDLVFSGVSHQASSSSASSSHTSVRAATSDGEKQTSAKQMMAELGDLWPEEDYSAEFDFKNFLSRFKMDK